MPAAKKAAPAAKKSAISAKAATQPTVTLKHLAAALSDSHDLPRKQAEAVLGDLVMLTTRHLKKGDKIRLTGLGILQVRKRAARMGRNPATGEAIKIKASKKVAFRAAKSELNDWLPSPSDSCTASAAASRNSCSAIHINAAASVGNRRMDRLPLVEVTSTTKAANPSRTSR